MDGRSSSGSQARSPARRSSSVSTAAVASSRPEVASESWWLGLPKPNGGNDRVCLGPGGTSSPFEGEIARGGGDDDRLFGGPGRDYLSPGPGNDTANGDAGQDYLVGSDGEDRMLGGSGNDDVFGGRGNDVVRGGPGVDRVNGGQGTDACFGTRSDRFIDCETINGVPA